MAMKKAKKAAKKAPAKKASAKKTSAKKTGTTAKKAVKKAPAKKAAKTKSTRKPNAAFMRPLMPSGPLAAIIGSTPMPRTEVTSQIWKYIKKNDLQDPKNKRMIKADAALKTVFGGKSTVNMFEMTKLVGKHLKK